MLSGLCWLEERTFRNYLLVLFSNFQKQSSCHKSRLTFTTDWSGAVSTFLGKEVAEAVEAVGKVVAGGEALAGQLLLAPNANEALFMPGLVPVVHSSSGDGLKHTDVAVVNVALIIFLFFCL